MHDHTMNDEQHAMINPSLHHDIKIRRLAASSSSQLMATSLAAALVLSVFLRREPPATGHGHDRNHDRSNANNENDRDLGS